MKNKFNWGIIGPGRIAQKFTDAVDKMQGSKVAAIASQSSSDLENLRKKMHSKCVYSSYEELVQDQEIDAVYIATPHRFHYENAMLCLGYSKPVLVEKAFTVNSREAELLVSTARQKKAFLMEAMWTRFLPAILKVGEWIKKGKIGEVCLVSSTLGFSAKRDKQDRLLNIELAGGSLLDLGIYNIAISQFIFRKPPVSFSVQGYIGETGVDESVSAVLDYGNGALSQFACTFLTRPLCQVEIYGTKGYILIHPVFNSTEKTTLVTKNKTLPYNHPHRINGFEFQIEEAQCCIRNGCLESPLMTHADSLENMRLVDEIRNRIGMKYPFE